MKSQSSTVSHPAIRWHADLKNSLDSVSHLLDFCGLVYSSAPYVIAEASDFPLMVPRTYATKIKKGDWFDPLLLQVLPRSDEDLIVQGFTDNPVGDSESQVAPGLLHKYHGRALLLASSACAIHCRFCLRRAFPINQKIQGDCIGDFSSAWEYLEKHQEIKELILSGGDPLMLGNPAIGRIIDKFLRIRHLKTLRIHTRMAIVLPSRIDDGLIELLIKLTEIRHVVIVIHANHASEISNEAIGRLRILQRAGVMLFQQGVLLKGINDSSEVLRDLWGKLIENGIIPYYLHQLDRVCGASHFEVEEKAGRRLMKELRKSLPGYALPKYVREKQGAESKVPLDRG